MLLRFVDRKILISGLVCIVSLVSRVAIGQTLAPIAPEIISGLKSLGAATAEQRQQFYDLVSQKADAQTVPALKAYRDGALILYNDQLAIYGERVDISGKGSVVPLVDAFTQSPILGDDKQPLYFLKPDLSKAVKAPPYREKRIIADMVVTLSLNDPDPLKRKESILSAADRTDEALLPALHKQLDAAPTGPFSRALRTAIARIEIIKGTPEQQREAIKTLAEYPSESALGSLKTAADLPAVKSDKALADSTASAISKNESYQTRLGMIRNTFYGISAGSILVLLALGLSIIFGLMGVINMAQGEFMMVGAFTTYVVSEFFKAHLPGLFDYYPIIAIPAAFLVAGAIGYLCELLVIRHLYGRPLETLLATWGIGLILIQLVRVWFGDNLSVKPPHWMEGGIEVMPDLTFPLNRVYIVLFCVVCMGLVYFVVNRTRLGLLLRATTQIREMAASSGVPTRRVDAMTFAFGAGLAGLAGVVVPLYNKINPTIGQEYIVNSFLVVVVGGVGTLAGAIYAGFGLGFLGKYLEAGLTYIPAMASSSSVVGQVLVLCLVVVFLQWRPAGLFPPRGRMADV